MTPSRRAVVLAAALGALGPFGCDEEPAPLDAGAAVDADLAPDAGAGCGLEPEPGPARAVFALPRAGEDAFFDLPWPTDVRRTASGTVDVSAFPNPRRNTFLDRYLAAMNERLEGYGTHGAIYFRFSTSVDPATLPASPEASIADDASVLLVDVDPDSPERGRRHPVVVRYQDCPTRFWPAHTVALRPVYGMPLASDRRYAAVITRSVRRIDGGELERDADFAALLEGGGDEAVSAAREVYAGVFDALAEAAVAPEELLSVTVFTTQDAIGETIAIRDWMHESYPAPTVATDTLVKVADLPRMSELTGTYGPNPIFQDGELPYSDAGGAIALGADGTPTVHGEYDARFTLTVPTTEMPPEGYPIVLWAHGTGGDHRSFVENGYALDLARLGFAALGVDQIHHGARNPTEIDSSILFFNFPNPDAARDNNRQSALDVVQQARLVGQLDLPSEFLDRGGQPVRFDPRRVYFMGHSQGGLNGPIFLAIDDGARGAVLSAASAVIVPALIQKVEPVLIPDLVVTLLNLPGGTWQSAYELEGFTFEHPIATLLQTWVEVSDGANYAHLVFESPRDGFTPKSVLMTEGLGDRYSPPASIEALAGAMFVPQVEPVHQVMRAAALRGIDAVAAPVHANVAGGAATAGLLQFPDDGHFAVYDNEVAMGQVLGFFESLQTPGPGAIPAPVAP